MIKTSVDGSAHPLASLRSANDNDRPECRALIPVSSTARPRRCPTVRRAAEFTAQLLAAKNKAPQARERRRADPAEALAAYQAAAQLSDAR